jgi:hypothetical protein
MTSSPGPGTPKGFQLPFAPQSALNPCHVFWAKQKTGKKRTVKMSTATAKILFLTPGTPAGFIPLQ